MKNELCPFCGKSPVVFDGDTNPLNNNIIGMMRCSDNDCIASAIWAESDEWNTRSIRHSKGKLHTVISVIEIAQKHVNSKVPGNTTSIWQFHSNVGDKIIKSLLFEVDALIADSGHLSSIFDLIEAAAESDEPECYDLISKYYEKNIQTIDIDEALQDAIDDGQSGQMPNTHS